MEYVLSTGVENQMDFFLTIIESANYLFLVVIKNVEKLDTSLKIQCYDSGIWIQSHSLLHEKHNNNVV